MLKGESISLRSLRESDLDFLFTIENNKELWRFGSEKKEYSRLELSNYIKNSKTHIRSCGQYRFVIDYGTHPIGFVDLFDFNSEKAGVGIILQDQYHKKGFASKAIKLLITHSFKTLKLKQLYCSIDSNNIASIQLFTSCNFSLVRIEDGMHHYKLRNNS